MYYITFYQSAQQTGNIAHTKELMKLTLNVMRLNKMPGNL